MYVCCIERLANTDAFVHQIFAKCGGFSGQSCVYLKHSFVSEGTFVFSNNSHWLLVDAQPSNCYFFADPNAMTMCKFRFHLSCNGY